MILRTEQKNKNGERIYINKFTGKYGILPRVSGVGKHGRLPDIARHYLTPAKTPLQRKTSIFFN